MSVESRVDASPERDGLAGEESPSERRRAEEHVRSEGGSRFQQRRHMRSHIAPSDEELEEQFERTLGEGSRRLGRRMSSLFATGAMGGIDVGTGVLGLLLVEHTTHSKLLGGLAFSIGFIALVLARSELFTEDFLVPVTTVVAKRCTYRALARLWAVTAVANLIGGWVITWLIDLSFPQFKETAVEAGAFYVHLGIGSKAAGLAVLGGAVITLMTWMQQSTDSVGVRVIPAITAGFLLGGGQLNHAIVNSLLMFAALHTGHAPFGYTDYLGTFAWAALWNIIGGIALVTVLRLAQVPQKIAQERRRNGSG